MRGDALQDPLPEKRHPVYIAMKIFLIFLLAAVVLGVVIVTWRNIP